MCSIGIIFLLKLAIESSSVITFYNLDGSGILFCYIIEIRRIITFTLSDVMLIDTIEILQVFRYILLL